MAFYLMPWISDLGFQSSIAPKSDRNEQRDEMKSAIAGSNPRSPRRATAIPGTFAYFIGALSSNPRSPRRATAINIKGVPILYVYGSNPRSPRRATAISTIELLREIVARFQSSIAPKSDRNELERRVMKVKTLFQSSIAPKSDRNFLMR